MEIVPIPALKDNYIWALINDRKEVIIVDPGEAEPVLAFLQQRSLTLVAILVTHHHWDHTAGIEALVQAKEVPVYGSVNEPVPLISHPLQDGDEFLIENFKDRFLVMAIPGHTLGHIAYYSGGNLFCGDTLFAGGCGRIFEGTALQMFTSLKKLMGLPGNTKIYCAHEYTLANLQFAKRVEPDNHDLEARLGRVKGMHAKGLVTLPSTMEDEIKTNPFLRCEFPSIREAVEEQVGKRLVNEVDVFAALREWKNKG